MTLCGSDILFVPHNARVQLRTNQIEASAQRSQSSSRSAAATIVREPAREITVSRSNRRPMMERVPDHGQPPPGSRRARTSVAQRVTAALVYPVGTERRNAMTSFPATKGSMRCSMEPSTSMSRPKMRANSAFTISMVAGSVIQPRPRCHDGTAPSPTQIQSRNSAIHSVRRYFPKRSMLSEQRLYPES